MQAQNLSDLYALYRAVCLPQCSASTDNQYSVQIGHFAAMLGRDPVVSDLTTDNLARLAAYLLQAKQHAPVTAQKAIARISCLWSFAARRGLTATWPAMPRIKVPRRAPVALMPDEERRMFDAAKACRGVVNHAPAALWFEALFSVLWDTAERIGAIVAWQTATENKPAVTWACLDWKSETLLVRAEWRKGGESDEIYKLHADTIALLRDMHAATPRRQDNAIFYCGDRSSLYKRMNWICKRAGLPADRRYKFHSFRRTVASIAHASGANASDILRHTDGTLARKAYLDPRISRPTISASEIIRRPATG